MKLALALPLLLSLARAAPVPGWWQGGEHHDGALTLTRGNWRRPAEHHRWRSGNWRHGNGHHGNHNHGAGPAAPAATPAPATSPEDDDDDVEDCDEATSAAYSAGVPGSPDTPSASLAPAAEPTAEPSSPAKGPEYAEPSASAEETPVSEQVAAPSAGVPGSPWTPEPSSEVPSPAPSSAPAQEASSYAKKTRTKKPAPAPTPEAEPSESYSEPAAPSPTPDAEPSPSYSEPAPEPSTTSKKPKPTPAHVELNSNPKPNSGGSSQFTGPATYWDVYTPSDNGGFASGVVACNGASLSGNIVALRTGWDGGAHCGKQVVVTNPANGNTEYATVVDQCATCSGDGLDLDPALFSKLTNGHMELGRFVANWGFA